MFYLKNPSLIIYFLCLTLYLHAQAPNRLTVVVRDPLGSLVSNAKVNLVKSENKEQTSVTSQLGKVEFTNLTNGEYQILVKSAGFQDYSSGMIVLKDGETKRVDISLEIAPIESKVDIDETDGIDMEHLGSVTSLTKKEIENLPSDPEELKRTLQRMAGESVTGGDLPISVNGITGATIPPKERIKHVRINRNVFSAQYESISGGGIEIVTDSNMDHFEGYAEFGFADSHFNATDPFLGKKTPFQSRSYRYGLSGPLGKKTSFSIDGLHSDIDSSAVVNAIILNSNLQAVDFRQTFATPKRSDHISFTLDSDLSIKHKIYFNYDFAIRQAKGDGVGGFSLPSKASGLDNQDYSLSFSDTYAVSPNLFNVTKFLGRYSKRKIFGGDNTVAINVSEAFLGGGSQTESSFSNASFEFYNDTTKKIKNYALGFGVMIRGQRVNEISRSNFGGTFTFGGKIGPVLDENNNPVTDINGNIITEQITSIESYRRTLLFRQRGYSGSQIRSLGGGADQFEIAGGNPNLSASQVDYAFYLQNSYGISDTLGISFGLRYENQTNIRSNLNLSPRFGVTWAPKSNEKKSPIFALPRVSVGFGVFYSRFDIENIIDERQANNTDRSYYFVTDTNILDSFPNAPSISLLEQSTLLKSKRLIDPALEVPLQRIFSVTATKKLPAKFSASFTLTHIRSFRQAITTNINAPFAGTYYIANQSSAIYPLGTAGNVYETSDGGKTEMTRFTTNLNFPRWKLFGKPIGINLLYNFTKARSNIVNGSGSPINPYDFSKEFAPTMQDGVHSLTGFFGLSLPHRSYIGGDWAVRTGSRFNIITGRDTNGDGYYSERPAFASDLSKSGLIHTKYGILDPNPLSTDNIIPRNLGRGTGSVDFNVFISKTFVFNEDKKNKKPPKQRLSFRTSLSNAFNINNKGNPVGNMSSPNFLNFVSGYSETGISMPSNPRKLSFSTTFYF